MLSGDIKEGLSIKLNFPRFENTDYDKLSSLIIEMQELKVFSRIAVLRT